MNPKSPDSRDEKPFVGMHIDDTSILDELEGRSPCYGCCKSRKYFCYSCYIPVAELSGKIPKVKLPVKIDIIKHRHEIDGKSTAAHAAVLAQNHVRVYTYPDIPDYSKEANVVLIYPCIKSVDISSLFNNNRNTELYTEEMLKILPRGHNVGTLMTKKLMPNSSLNDVFDRCDLPIKKAVFIDSTWNQSRGIYKDERVHCIPSVVLQNRISQFWRHQKGSPRWYLSTIEAIHQFLLELHINAWGVSGNYQGPYCENYRLIRDENVLKSNNVNTPYNGQYDNLLFFFSHMYKVIHSLYDHDQLQAYKRPLE